jgi:Tfp pilus assembly protein PilF
MVVHDSPPPRRVDARIDLPVIRLAWIHLALLVTLAAGGCGSDATGSAETTHVRPESVDAALEAAEAYLDAGDAAKAETILVALVERAPGNVDACELLGRTLLYRAATEEDGGAAASARERAYQQYRRATELAPRSAGFHQNAGEIAQLTGRDDVALAHYRAAAERAPASAKHWIYAAQVLIRTGRLDEATEALRRARAIDPDAAIVHASLATIALERERYDEARDLVGEARAIAPAEIGYRVIAARIERRAGNPTACLDLLLPLDERQRATEAVTHEIAAGYTALGLPEKAAEAWSARYGHRSGDDDAARIALRTAEAWLEAGALDEARAWLAQATKDGATAANVDAIARRIDDD